MPDSSTALRNSGLKDQAHITGDVAIRANIVGMKPLARILKTLANTGIDLTEAMDAVGTIMARTIDENFDKQVSKSGQRWKPVSDWYAERKSKAGRSPSNLLIYDGTLRKSLQDGVITTSQKAAVGTNLKYARIHNFGGRVGGGTNFVGKKIPRRQYMFLTPEAMKDIKRAILIFIKNRATTG